MSILLQASFVAALSSAQLTTVAEQTNFQRTGRYDEVERLCPAFAEAYAGRVRCETFGTTPEGRPMLALVASDDGALTPDVAHARARPVVLFQGGIHAGEIDGKDAGFWLLRDILDGRTLPGALAHVTVVFVPVFNIDGHERFGAFNRPNQRGPVESGWRTTGQNLNMNRDYVKADTPEMQAMLRLLGQWDPIVYADLHVTDGAKFQHDISVLVEPSNVGPGALRREGKRLSNAILRHLEATGHMPVDFYPSFNDEDRPESGVAMPKNSARFSHAYWALHNRFGILVETHSWKTYDMRVKSTYDAVHAMIEGAVRDGATWLAAARAANDEAAALAGTDVALAYDNGKHSVTIDFKGYEYSRVRSEISGSTWTIYDETRPQVWRIPYFDTLEPSIVASAPEAGYVVAAAHADWVRAKLDLHGIRYTTVERDVPASDDRGVEAFRASRVTFGSAPGEGRQTATVQGSWARERRILAKGSLFIPINQPRAVLAMQMFEPSSTESFLRWGFFNAVFESKEYMEAYVAEQVARDMLAADAVLREQFERRLREDAVFAASPSARLDFFYRRHPSYDERLNLYPVLRVSRAP